MTDKRKSLAELRKSEHTGPVERSIDVCVAGALIAEYEELDAQFRDVYVDGAKPSNTRMSDKGQAREIAERMEQVRAEMLEHMASVRVGRIPRHEWREFVAEHPPREGDREDQMYRVDMDALLDNLEPHVLTINGDPLAGDDWEFFSKVAGDGDLRELATVVATMHVNPVNIPKSRLDWLRTREGDDDSKSPDPTE